MNKKLAVCLLTAMAALAGACAQNGSQPPQNVASAPTPAASVPAPPPDASHDESEENAMPRISGADAIKMAKEKNALIVDTRSMESFNMVHIKNAINVTMDKFEAGTHNLPKTRPIIAYCS
ncbi:MAG: rhodanese-like domain-containing protein [Blastocatellia bacterium]